MDKMKKAYEVHAKSWNTVEVKPMSFEEWRAEIENCPRTLAKIMK